MSEASGRTQTYTSTNSPISLILRSLRRENQISEVVHEQECQEQMPFCTTDYLTAGSPLTSSKELIKLAQSEHYRVRARVAENPNCPATILVWLVQDPDAEVRLSVAYNPLVPRSLLEWLVEDENPDVLFALAENHNLPESLLEKLTRSDHNPYVSERAKKTLERLAYQENVFSAEKVADERFVG